MLISFTMNLLLVIRYLDIYMIYLYTQMVTRCTSKVVDGCLSEPIILGLAVTGIILHLEIT